MPRRFSNPLSSELLGVKSLGKTFLVHSGILTAQSESPHLTVRPGAKKIDLSGWESDTVELLIEFLYTGDYVLEPAVGGGNILGEAGNDKKGGGGQDNGEREGGGDGKIGRRGGANTLDALQSLVERDVAARDINTDIALIHAKIYTLAKHTGVEPLRAIALKRIQEALGEGSTVGGAAIKFLEYVYSHTSPGEPMRNLVSRFVVRNIEKLECGELAKLLCLWGGLTTELMEGVVGRICRAERENLNFEMEVRGWRGRVAASNKWIRQAKANNVEDAQRLEMVMKQLEGANAEIRQLEGRVQELEIANMVGVQRLEDNASGLEENMQESRAAHTGIQELEADMQWLEDKLKHLKISPDSPPRASRS